MHQNSNNAHKNVQKISYIMGCVKLTQYCGKLYGCHLFCYGGLCMNHLNLCSWLPCLLLCSYFLCCIFTEFLYPFSWKGARNLKSMLWKKNGNRTWNLLLWSRKFQFSLLYIHHEIVCDTFDWFQKKFASLKYYNEAVFYCHYRSHEMVLAWWHKERKKILNFLVPFL